MVSLFYIVSNLLPLWFFWDTFYAFAVASGMDQSYIESYLQYYTSPGWLIFIVFFLCYLWLFRQYTLGVG